MKVVLDTNVLMSGIFFGGIPARVLEQWYRKRVTLVITEEIYTEYYRVYKELSQKYSLEAGADILELIISKASLVTPAVLHENVCADRYDDKFIAAALAAKAIVVTGDKALLAVAGYRGILIISPRNFFQKHLT